MTFDRKNPFVDGNPSFTPDKNHSDKTLTLGDIGAVKTMIKVSMHPNVLEALGLDKGMSRYSMDDTPDADNLSAAVTMWRAREREFARKQTGRHRGPAYGVYIPNHLLSASVPQPTSSTSLPNDIDTSGTGASSHISPR